jgi:hypothetical protein
MSKQKKGAMRAAGATKASRVARIEVVRESRPRPGVMAKQDDVLDAKHTGVAYSAGRANPYQVYYGGAMLNPDAVLIENGQDPSLYDGVLMRHPYVAGCLDQKIERANKTRIIVAGDPSDSRSVMIANLARRCFESVPYASVVLGRWLRNADFVGYGAIEKVFTRNRDGLVYPGRLIDRECKNIKFKDDGTALWTPNGWAYQGEPIPQRKMSFLRTGSINSGYGDGTGRRVWAACYLIEKTVELMLDGVEEFGRPIPVVYMPKAKDVLSAGEREKIRQYARAVHSRFIEIPTNELNARIDIGNAPLASSGQVGRPEMAIIEMLVTWIYVAMIRVAQTMNKTGGSRSLEDTRYEITDDAARPLCKLLDDGLNMPLVEGDLYTGWMTDFCDFNFPDDPIEILPRFTTPTLSQEDINGFHKRTMEAIDRGLGKELSKDQYLRMTGSEKAKDDGDRLGGTPQTRVTETTTDSLDAPNGNPKTLADVAENISILSRRLDKLVGLAA